MDQILVEDKILQKKTQTSQLIVLREWLTKIVLAKNMRQATTESFKRCCKQQGHIHRLFTTVQFIIHYVLNLSPHKRKVIKIAIDKRLLLNITIKKFYEICSMSKQNLKS